MKKLLFLLCFGVFLYGCIGSSKENSASVISQVRDEDKTVVEQIREISLLYEEYNKNHSKREGELWNNARSKSDIAEYARKTNELANERDNQINKILNALKGREIPIYAIPDSLFEVTGGKIRNCALEEYAVSLKITFFVKLKKDFTPDFHCNVVTGEYYAPKLPSLEVKFYNSQGAAIGHRMSKFLFNFDKAKEDAVRGQVYAHAGYECNEMDSGITFTIKVGSNTDNYKDLSSIGTAISHIH